MYEAHFFKREDNIPVSPIDFYSLVTPGIYTISSCATFHSDVL
jgi:hypothetical protein